MDFMKTLRENQTLSTLLGSICDVEILSEFKTPEDGMGHLTYNIPGKTFAVAGSGSEYILLEDGSVGYWGSEGECGRLAENLKEFIEFVIYCPYWQDYLREGEYQSRDELERFAKKNYESMVESTKEYGIDLSKAQQKLSEGMGIELKTDITDILMRFHHCANREPRFIATYKESDGSAHSGTGSLFDR